MMTGNDPAGDVPLRRGVPDEIVVARDADGRPTATLVPSAIARFAGAQLRFTVSALCAMPEARRTATMEKRLNHAFWGLDEAVMTVLEERARAGTALPDDLSALGIDVPTLLADRPFVQTVFTEDDQRTLARGGIVMAVLAFCIIWSMAVGFMTIAWGAMLLALVATISGGFLWQLRRARRADM